MPLLFWGDQNRTLCSRFGLTIAEESGKITSLDTLAILRVMRPLREGQIAGSCSIWCPPGPFLPRCFPAGSSVQDLSAPPALVGSFHQVPWTCVRPVCISISRPNPFPPKARLLFHLLYGDWDCWRPVLLVKTEAKKAFSIVAFSLSCVTRYSVSSSNRLIFSPTFPFVASILTEALLNLLDIPSQAQFLQGFSFPNFILGCSNNVSVFPSLLTSSVCFLFFFFVWVYLGAPSSSTQASLHFCLTLCFLAKVSSPCSVKWIPSLPKKRWFTNRVPWSQNPKCCFQHQFHSQLLTYARGAFLLAPFYLSGGIEDNTTWAPLTLTVAHRALQSLLVQSWFFPWRYHLCPCGVKAGGSSQRVGPAVVVRPQYPGFGPLAGSKPL